MKTEEVKEGILNLNNFYPENVPRLGILQWFTKDDYTQVENAVKDLKSAGITDIRTGISWADYHTKGGKEWYDWLIPKLAENLNLLPCLYYTPPALGIEPSHLAPPKNPKTFADFTDVIINRYGQYFDYVEFWNEPNNLSAYNWFLDPSWTSFEKMISMAAYWAHQLNKKTVLGGMSPIDAGWLDARAKNKMLEHIDVIGIHGFPDVFDIVWNGWNNEIEKIQRILDENQSRAEIWITGTGYSSWRNDEQNQIPKLIDALKSPVKKIYWQSLYDLSPERSSQTGFHQDEREYHFGMKKANGTPKLIFRMLSHYTLSQMGKETLLLKPSTLTRGKKKGILITGGAGFIGTNLVWRLLNEGKRVIIYDNLSRPGAEHNLHWLSTNYPDLEIMIADVTDIHSLRKAVSEAGFIFHFAAQVAVTSSLDFPGYDYEINTGGTINLLETIRQSKHKPPLLFTSTNKVYGDLSGLELHCDNKRYFPAEKEYLQNGINENYPLSFQSPYGNSKGSADQYILDYARSFGLRNIVFRMSCIYGPHQFGTVDQGWIAHFLNQSIKKDCITIYGDGKQVRDILYIDDLVEAFMLAIKNIDKITGHAFNIGGGPNNAISLIDLIQLMHNLDHLKIHLKYDNWRTGDQKYYVSDTRKYKSMVGWQPKISYQEGITNIFNWLYDQNHPSKQKSVYIKK